MPTPTILKSKDVDLYDYYLTKENVDNIFKKYRLYKDKTDIITKRLKSSLLNDNLGIFSSTISNPTENKVEQLERISKFVNEVDSVIKTFSYELSNEEKLFLEKGLKLSMSNEDLEIIISVSHGLLFNIKRSCYIKIARWFDIEVYSDNE